MDKHETIYRQNMAAALYKNARLYAKWGMTAYAIAAQETAARYHAK